MKAERSSCYIGNGKVNLMDRCGITTIHSVKFKAGVIRQYARHVLPCLCGKKKVKDCATFTEGFGLIATWSVSDVIFVNVQDCASPSVESRISGRHRCSQLEELTDISSARLPPHLQISTSSWSHGQCRQYTHFPPMGERHGRSDSAPLRRACLRHGLDSPADV